VDYRKLNSITRKDVYPLPRVEDALDHLGGAKYFCILDLISGFYQIEVDSKDREKTAFVTPEGLYEFKRMPMGLCNSPATFQRLMDTIFRSLSWWAIFIYLDDIIVHRRTFEAMLDRLRQVLEILKTAGLTLKPSKCKLGEQKLKYLGHMISAKGVEVDPDKLAAIYKFQELKNITHIRQFVNLCGYYRRFIKDFSLLAAPLNYLLKKDVPFLWTEKQKCAFEKMKLVMMSPPVLTFPHPNLPKVIHTDACGYGVGAVLCQIEDSKEKVIAYASRSLTSAEQKYTTSEQECLAIVFAVGKFRPYLWGQKFTAITDHHAFRWLFSIKDANGRLARRSLLLQSYDMDVQHKPGKKHVDADAFSRRPIEVDSSAHLSDLMKLNVDELNFSLFQSQDTTLGKIIESLRLFAEGWEPKISMKLLQDNTVRDDVLYRANFCAEGKLWKLCVPKSLRLQIMESIHADETGGHLGATRMYYLLSSRFYWSGMYRDVRRYVRGCKVCNLFRPKKGGKVGKMQTFRGITKPFERLGIDFIGPFKKSLRGNKHVIVMIDHYSRYVEASAVAEATVDNVILSLHEKIVFRHSCPRENVVDRGRQFISNLMKEHAEKSKYKICYTAKYHPQSNGITERTNKTLKSILKKYIEPNQTDWDVKLLAAVFAYNITRHEATQFCPFYLLYGHEARIPADIEFPVWPDEPASAVEFKEAARNSSRLAAVENSSRMHYGNKERYDKNRTDPIFRSGQKAWRVQPVRKKGYTQAFLPQITGPYEILEQTGPVNFKIKLISKNKNSKVFIVHANDLCTIATEFDSSRGESADSVELAICRRKRRKNRKPTSGSKLSSSSDSGTNVAAVPSRTESKRRTGSSAKSATTVDPTVDDDRQMWDQQ